MTLREFRLPDLGEGLTESDIVGWSVAVGDAVALDQVIAEVETAKALVEIPSPFAGVITALHAEPGQTVSVGDPLVTFEVPDDAGNGTSGAAPAAPVAAADAAEAPAAPAAAAAPAAPTPEAAAVPEPAPAPEPPARPEPAEPTLVGYGAAPERGGHPARRPRRYSDQEPAETRDEGSTAAAQEPAPETRTPVRGVRKHTAAAMVASAFTAPQATVQLTTDATATVELLGHLRSHPGAHGEHVTVLALVARAVCALLPRHPALTGRWSDLPDGSAEIVRPAHVNLGIAVDTDRGLVVPNIPAADTLGLAALTAALDDLARTARAGRTAPERLTGGTFTITNVGVLGVDAGTPILNPGEPGILGLGAVRRLPWEHEGQVALRHVVALSLTFDHRVADGAQAARFLAELGAVLADPVPALLLGVDPEGGCGE